MSTPFEQGEPEPPSPIPPRRTRMVVIVIASLLVGAAIAVGVTLAFHKSSRSGSSHPFAGYGQDPVNVARKLHTCTSTDRIGSSHNIVRCTLPLGEKMAILTEDDQNSQDLAVALIRDNDSGECVVVIPGVIFTGIDGSVLTGALGDPDAFAVRNGGYTLCPVP